jgi:Na+/melibiose symporter-like transporter
MKRLCDGYVRHAMFLGVLYCAIPVAIWYGAMFATIPFRLVYVLRLVLSLVLGCWVAAYVNEYGVRTWMTKHRSQDGPATAWDGFLIGGAVGMGTVLVPPLTALIATNHLEQAKAVVIGCWLAGIVCGALNGSLLGSIARRYMSRNGTVAG